MVEVEGMTVLDAHDSQATLLAVTDVDGPTAASRAITLLVRR